MDDERKVIVFDIQKFSYHDGPGIRTTVFLKGCNLNCFWCQNPESQKKAPQIMYYSNNCIECVSCIGVCDNEAIYVKQGGGLKIDYSRCKNCGRCVEICPTTALKTAGKEMTVSEVLDIVEQDREMYELSGGGMTVSGGEPLLQKNIVELLKEAKRRNISTAIETAGNVSCEMLKKVVPYTDLFLYDIKTFDEKKHVKYCGCSNKKILANLKFLKKIGAKANVRTPVIPGVNDTEEEIKRIKKYVMDVGYEKPELLKFNKLGSSKYTALGMTYEAMELELTEDEKFKKLEQI
jgi:pyruvate formate lyase activating enzyme